MTNLKEVNKSKDHTERATSTDKRESPTHISHRGGRSESGGLVPRFTKLDFPRFNGTVDPIVWLSYCDNFFHHQRTPEEEKLIIASFHLDVDAQLWFFKLQRDIPNISWPNFKSQCELHFGPPIRSNKLGELSKLRETSTLDQCQF